METINSMKLAPSKGNGTEGWNLTARTLVAMADDMTGKIVLITGGNAGIGKETAVGLASKGAHVVFTSRNATRGNDALAEIKQRSGNDTVDVMTLDLASLASVREFATRSSPATTASTC